MLSREIERLANRSVFDDRLAALASGLPSENVDVMVQRADPNIRQLARHLLNLRRERSFQAKVFWKQLQIPASEFVFSLGGLLQYRSPVTRELTTVGK